MKSAFALEPRWKGAPLVPVWRVTKGLEKEVGVSSSVSDLTGRELAEVLQQVDAVITTPSTTMIEAMLLGLPVAVLDYCNCPHYVQPAWRITAPEHIGAVLAELVDPPPPKMLWQDAVLHDSLECATPAAPRLRRLATDMMAAGRKAREEGRTVQFPHRMIKWEGSATALVEPGSRLSSLFPDCEEFSNPDFKAHQLEVVHLRRYARKLELQLGERRLGGNPDRMHEDSRIYRLIDHWNRAQETKAPVSPVAVWDVAIGGVVKKAILLQPPGELAFRTPSGTAGFFSAALAMHPDVWSNPESGGCQFVIRIDDRVVFGLGVNPVASESDRRWHELSVDVPFNPSGFHKIVIGSSSQGTQAFRWALWGEPRFVWREEKSSSGSPG
jgi:hypothetical protein